MQPKHDWLFGQVRQLAPAAMAGFAQSLGLDVNRFNTEFDPRESADGTPVT